jgi:hypothetical protein
MLPTAYAATIMYMSTGPANAPVDTRAVDRLAKADPFADETAQMRWKPIATEVAASVMVLVSVGGLVGHWLNVYLTFFGESVTVTPADVHRYHGWVGVLVVSVAGSFVASVWRGGWKSKVWHTFAALVGLAAALVFSVSMDLPGDEGAPSRAPSVGCHSGGDSLDCPGG